MNSAERRMVIYTMLQENSTVEVNALAAKFNVSTMTIRRDLAVFEQQGLVVTTYGGAYISQGVGIEPSFSLKQGQMALEKQLIAKKAASLVEEGNSIIIDCGTTTLHIAKYLEKKRVIVISNSWPIANHIEPNSKVKLILAPGEYSHTSAGALSSMTVDFYKNFQVDIAFIGTQGFSYEHGATVPDIEDANVKKAIFESAKKRVLVIDHSKIGNHYLAKHAEPTDFDIIVTDSNIKQKEISQLKKLCNKIITTD